MILLQYSSLHIHDRAMYFCRQQCDLLHVRACISIDSVLWIRARVGMFGCRCAWLRFPRSSISFIMWKRTIVFIHISSFVCYDVYVSHISSFVLFSCIAYAFASRMFMRRWKQCCVSNQSVLPSLEHALVRSSPRARLPVHRDTRPQRRLDEDWRAEAFARGCFVDPY